MLLLHSTEKHMHDVTNGVSAGAGVMSPHCSTYCMEYIPTSPLTGMAVAHYDIGTSASAMCMRYIITAVYMWMQ